MKILYVCRLYSGFEESLKSGIWNPKGAPTIARMIEHLDSAKEHDLTIILTQKGHHPDHRLKPIQNIKVQGLSKPITLICGSDIFPRWLWKFQDKFSNIYQIFQIYRAYQKIKPNIVYCDRVNILPAAFLSRFTKARVIWRVMGVLEEMHIDKSNNTLRSKLQRWLWRSPFKAVICTLDGSGGGPWLDAVLNPNTPAHLLINGIYKNQKSDSTISIPKDGTKALFVGRLESLKGIKEFMDAFYESSAHHKDLHAVIAGDGSLKSEMIAQAQQLNMQNCVHFLGSITPAQLKHVRQNCDFYISLNKQGNLSNVNLEALSDALPTIIPISNPARGIDVDTDRLVPKNVFYRFGKVGDKAALVSAIKYMSDPKNCARHKTASEECAAKILPSWHKRIAQEISIFETVNTAYDFAIVIADLGSGGAQKVATSLISELTKQNFKTALITLADDKDDFFKCPENVTRITLNAQRKSHGILQRITANIERITALRRILKQLTPHTTISFIAPTNVTTVIASIGLGTTTIISERNDPSRQSFGRLWDTLRLLCYRFADKVSANSPNAIESLRAYVPKSKLYFVPNALSCPDKKYTDIKTNKDKTILIVGRLHPQKAHHILLDAFALTRENYPEWSLTIAGEGPLRSKLEQRVLNLKLEGLVTFTGIVENPYDLYAKASIFALPSLHEGTPNALLEAMSCGVAPVISDACEGAMPYVTHKESGLIIPVNDVKALAQAFETLMKDQYLRKKISIAARDKVAPLYKKTTADLWHDVIHGA